MIKKTQPVKTSAKASAVKTTKTNSSHAKSNTKKRTTKSRRVNNSTQKYGISKLEADFAHNFLDKLGLKYIYEYEAKDIGRYYDFAVTAYKEIPFIMENKHGIESIKQEGQNVPISFMIEVDGNYWHSNPNTVNEKKLNPMQKHNKFVDFVKDKWCDLHCIPLLRIWEEDIRKNPKKVFEMLNVYIGNGNKKKRIDELKKRPH